MAGRGSGRRWEGEAAISGHVASAAAQTSSTQDTTQNGNSGLDRRTSIADTYAVLHCMSVATILHAPACSLPASFLERRTSTANLGLQTRVFGYHICTTICSHGQPCIHAYTRMHDMHKPSCISIALAHTHTAYIVNTWKIFAALDDMMHTA